MSAGGRTSTKILLIEEDPKQTELYSDLIRGVEDCQIDVIADPESAAEWVGRFSYHLVVMDCDETGNSSQTLGIVETIKRISPVTSVVMIAANATVEQAVAAIRIGAEDYLKKPFNVESFQLAVKRGLDRKTVFGENSGASSYLNLVNSCQMISASLEQGRIFGIIQSFILRELRSDHSAIYRIDNENPVRVEDGQTEFRRDRAMEEIIDIALHASGSLGKMAQANEVYRFVDRGQLTPGLFVFRFRCAGGIDFFCVCLSPERPAGMEGFESRLKLLKAQIEVTGKNIEEFQGVQSLVYVDDATGLYNTRYLYNILDREIAQAQITQKSFAILFLDGDRFKSINDNYGHLAGTKLLNELGSRLRRYTRDRDTVFRYGGDEFVAVLPTCDLETAKRVAERIRSSIEKHTFLQEEGLNVKITVSIGVALYPDHADSIKAVINCADHAMYSAKKTTRNSVFIAPLPPKPGAAPGVDTLATVGPGPAPLDPEDAAVATLPTPASVASAIAAESSASQPIFPKSLTSKPKVGGGSG